MVPFTFFKSFAYVSLICGITCISAVSINPPPPSSGFNSIKTPDGIQIRYKEPNICETTKGVKSYSGYVDLDADTHLFFWFFEARNSASTAPVTLWLNGGPGSDSLLGTLIENGPCTLTNDSSPKALNNTYSWNANSNVLYLSQPVGVGFSYRQTAAGSLDPNNVLYQPQPVNGVWPINSTLIDTTQRAAVDAWKAVQALFSALQQQNEIKSKTLNLFTESYGGHYGPIFFDYFVQQNDLIANGQAKGNKLDIGSLGVGNGIIDWLVQGPSYADYAIHNTYGIKTVNDTVYDFMKFAYNTPYTGCADAIGYCRDTNYTTAAEKAVCAEASYACRDAYEGLWFTYSTRGSYDIRTSADEGVPTTKYAKAYLNSAPVQSALGVSLNWTATNYEVYDLFSNAGDYIYPFALQSLNNLLNRGIKVLLYYGDADFNCNWFGGEAVSLAANWTHADKFASAGYADFTISNQTYGAVRQYENFAFLRLYESGHQVPYFQPLAALELFERHIFGNDIATGKTKVTDNYATLGPSKSTYTEPYVPLPGGDSSDKA